MDSNPITLLLADSQESASLVMQAHRLDINDTAVVSIADWLKQTKLLKNETLYASSTASPTLVDEVLNAVERDLQSGESVCLVITKP